MRPGCVERERSAGDRRGLGACLPGPCTYNSVLTERPRDRLPRPPLGVRLSTPAMRQVTGRTSPRTVPRGTSDGSRGWLTPLRPTWTRGVHAAAVHRLRAPTRRPSDSARQRPICWPNAAPLPLFRGRPFPAWTSGPIPFPVPAKGDRRAEEHRSCPGGLLTRIRVAPARSDRRRASCGVPRSCRMCAHSASAFEAGGAPATFAQHVALVLGPPPARRRGHVHSLPSLNRAPSPV